MSLREDVVAAAEAVLHGESEGLTEEALARQVGAKVGRLLPAKQITGLLRELPQRYVEGADGRWRLRERPADVGDEPDAPTESQLRVPLHRGYYVVFDLEALSQDATSPATEIIQIAAQRFTDGHPEELWVTLVRPRSGVVPANIAALTGIGTDQVKDAPPIADAIAEFLAYIGDLPLIAHNGASYDGPLVRVTCERLGIPLPETFQLLDTLPLARVLLPQLQAHTVTSLAQHFGCFREGAHQADVDVAMLAGIVDALTRKMRASPTGTMVYELLRRANDPWADLLELPDLPIDLAQVIGALGRNITPLLPDRAPPRRSIDGLTVDEVFDAAEAASRTRRPAQIELADVAAEAFRDDGFAVVEAGTGTGKSLGYLVPAALAARAAAAPVAISTFSRPLQAQLVQRELPFVQELIPELTYSMLQGRANYLSLSRLAEELESALDDERIPRASAWLLALLVRFAEVSDSGNLESVEYTVRSLDEYLESDGAIWQILGSLRSSGDDRRPGNLAEFYHRARDNAGRSDLVVVNHALLLRHLLTGEEEPFASRVVCDEAHTLEDAATSALETHISESEVRRVLRGVHDPARRAGLSFASRRSFGMAADDPRLQAVIDCVDRVQAAFASLTDRLHKYAAAQTVISAKEFERYGVRVQIDRAALSALGGPALRTAAESTSGAIGALRASVERLTADISGERDDRTSDAGTRRRRRAVRMARARLRDLAKIERDFRWFWTFSDQNAYVRLIELQATDDVGGSNVRVGLRGVPINVGPELWVKVWSRLAGTVCVSATLTVFGQGFDFFTSRVGLEPFRVERSGRRLTTKELPHPFDYHDNALLLLPNDLPAPRDTDLKQNFPLAVAALLKRFVPFFHGRTLALFTANRRRDLVYETVAPPLAEEGYQVLCQGHGSQRQLMDTFREDHTSSLLGSRSFWEGVDVPGESLSYLFLEKLPYPSLGDPVEAARMSAVEAAGGDAFHGYMLPKMTILLKQGFGRLIRSETDRGVAVLLDKRLRNAMYRMEVLRSLPDPTVGYESDTDMFRRAAQWMGLAFDPDDLPAPTVSDVARAIAENELPNVFVPEEDFDAVARPRLLSLQQAIWGQDAFRPGQDEIMKAVLAGEDVLTLLPTGAGKSRTFQLPALIRPGLTLVISPLIALIRDQVEKLREVPGMTAAAALVSGMDTGSQEDVLRDAAHSKVKLLYVSPERLRDPRFQAILPQLPLVQLVIDEAHCISTWGHDFRPDFLEITQLLAQRRNAQYLPVHALTATATPRVQEEIKDRLQMGTDGHDVLTLSGDFARKNLVYRMYKVPKAQERDALAVGIVYQLVSDQERGGAGVVYVATRRQAEQFATLLRHRNIAAQPYHGGLDTPVRHQIQERFMQGDLDVVVATNAFGMGVDKSDIRFVLHYDHPQSLEAYAQESGRAGRDGQEAYAILLSHPQTQRTLRFIYKKGMPDRGTLQGYRRALSKANDALGNAVRLPDGTLLCDPDDVSGLAGVDPTQARLLLFSFQEADLVRRGEDCTMEASILLNQDPEAILAQLDGADRQLAQALLAHIGATRDHQVMYHAVDFTRATQCDPRSVDPLLVRLAGQDLLLYRPFKRGMTFLLEPALQDDRALDRIAQRFADRYAAFDERLQVMLDHIALHGGTACRSAYIINYLTGRNDAPRCGTCDLCSPTSEHLPWDPGVRLYGEPLRVDPYLAILAAVRDHDGWFGRGTIEKILLGIPVRMINGEQTPLSQAARSSDYFGDLKDAGCSDAVVKSALSALIEGGYLHLIDRHRRDGESYSAIGIMQKGRDALAGGVPLPGTDSSEVA